MICSQLVLFTVFLNTFIVESSIHKHCYPSEKDLFRAATLKRNFGISMSPREITFLYHAINISARFLEFGASGATLLACALHRQYNRTELYIIDSTSNYESLHFNVNPCIKQSMAVVELIDLGPVTSYGFPTTKSHEKAWSQYSMTANKFIGSGIDTILVDGPFRIASIANSLLLFPTSHVYVHDYKKYEAELSDIADTVQHCDSLMKLTRKPTVTDTQLKKILQQYCSNPN